MRCRTYSTFIKQYHGRDLRQIGFIYYFLLFYFGVNMKHTAFLTTLMSIGLVTASITANAFTETNAFDKGIITNTTVLIGNVFLVPGNSFVDNWNFSISPTEQFAGFSADIDNLPAFEIGLSSFGATLYGPSQTWSAIQEGDSFRINSLELAPGNYTYQVFGTVVGTIGAAYSGTLSAFVVSVPEPETYIMMLAGLGLMGFISRRRKAELA